MSTVLVGVSLAYRLIAWKTSRTSQVKAFRIEPVVYYTSLAMVFRLTVTPFVNYFMYKFMMPIVVGQSFSDAAIIALVPGLLVFDAILVLYSVPTSYMIAKIINKNLSVGNHIF
jgi:hypothetical protein